MKGDRQKLYGSADAFFSLEGTVLMKLTPQAAIAVCEAAAAKGLIVVRVEGGVWHNPGFESRLDCIWDGDDPPISIEGAHLNNRRAAAFIQAKAATHDVFILTTPAITGYEK